jgi:hypothetical protein
VPWAEPCGACDVRIAERVADLRIEAQKYGYKLIPLVEPAPEKRT